MVKINAGQTDYGFIASMVLPDVTGLDCNCNGCMYAWLYTQVKPKIIQTPDICLYIYIYFFFTSVCRKL